jgi:hypothetical protein
MNCLFCICSVINIIYNFKRFLFDYRSTIIVWIWCWRLWGFINGCVSGRYALTGWYRLTTDVITKYCIFIKNLPYFFLVYHNQIPHPNFLLIPPSWTCLLFVWHKSPRNTYFFVPFQYVKVNCKDTNSN